jgi:hypothetical protein
MRPAARTRLLLVVPALCLLAGLSLPDTAAAGSPPGGDEPVREVVITASGDILTHTSLWRSAQRGARPATYDFVPNFAGIREVLDGEADICHLETPLVGKEPSSYPIFSTPPTLATALRKSGFEGCSTASNHSLDQGLTGIASTLRILDAAGLRHSGMRANERDSAVALYTTSGGVRVAHLSYTFSTNGIPLPKHAPWSVNIIDARRMLVAARTAGAAADLVVLSIHWGNEYQEQPSSTQLRLARELAASGEVDLIIGHHAHVLQPAEVVNGVPVLYGLGNLWSGQGPWSEKPFGDISAIAKLHFLVDGQGPRFVGGSYIPTVVNPSGWRVTTAAAAPNRQRACDAQRHAARLLRGMLAPSRTRSC